MGQMTSSQLRIGSIDVEVRSYCTYGIIKWLNYDSDGNEEKKKGTFEVLKSIRVWFELRKSERAELKDARQKIENTSISEGKKGNYTSEEHLKDLELSENEHRGEKQNQG